MKFTISRGTIVGSIKQKPVRPGLRAKLDHLDQRGKVAHSLLCQIQGRVHAMREAIEDRDFVENKVIARVNGPRSVTMDPAFIDRNLYEALSELHAVAKLLEPDGLVRRTTVSP